MDAIISEIDEVKQGLGLLHNNMPKWWKADVKYFECYLDLFALYRESLIDLENTKEELIDILHFLIDAFIQIGMNANEVFEKYADKNKINIRRQETGY